MLWYTKVKLEVITDIDMYLMIEKGIRGGVSMITHKYTKANNADISDYKRDEPTSHIIYWDANNLYGWVMSQCVPTGGFHWVSDEELSKLDVRNIAKDADKGYILEVDLEYPDSLHDDHGDYPLAPERRTINKKQLSPYSQLLIDELGMKGKPTEKLVPTLHDKTKYVLHYHNLKQYMSLGLRLTKIHRAIGFHQRKWLQPYIDFNTEMRKAAKNTIEKISTS